MLFKREKGYLISFIYTRDVNDHGISSVCVTTEKKVKINDIKNIKEELKRTLFYTDVVILNIQKLPI